ncbi:PD40 domain-containing protein [candidate division KSB1 bacterium]|nr:PD40 domain-containing protein [candidate division KSB1 bacterium]
MRISPLLRHNSIFFLYMMIIAFPIRSQIPGEALGARQNPRGVIWQQIETPHFRIIFPMEIIRDARSVANALEHIYKPGARTLGVLPGRISLILHNRTTISNGFVTLAPRRTEWFNTPPQVGLIHSVPWYDLLAVHEYRHIVQFDKAFSGFNRLLYYLMGEIGWAAGAGFSIPYWFWEGDAVVMETALTRGGRGRMPEFDMPTRTMLLSGKKYSYYKMTMGSYKNWLADAYAYGYLMNTYVRRHFGPLVWPSVLNNTSDFSFFPYRFSYALNRNTGKGVMKTHSAMLAELEELWRQQSRGVLLTEATRINGQNDGFMTWYRYPQALEDGSVIVYKYGFADQGAFVRLQGDGREQVLFHPNPTDGAPHSVVGDALVWAERMPDPRWGYRDYSVIKKYDLKTGKKYSITHRSRYFAPALSPDGKSIAAVAFESDNSCLLTLLDAHTGQVLKKWSTRENDFLMTPRWSADGKKLVFNRLGKQGRALSMVDLDSEDMAELIAPGDTYSALPVFHSHYILYNGDFGGINNIQALDLRTGRLYRVTSRPYGAFNPCVSADGKTIVFNDYDMEGLHLAEMVCDPARWIALDSLPDRTIRYYEPLINQEAGVDFMDHITQKEWPVTPYSSYKHLFRPHSWTFEGDALAEAYGLSLYSLNLLGTVQSNVGFQYNRNEKNGHIKAGLSYGGLYPLIDLDGLYGVRASTYQDADDSARIFTWREKTVEGTVRLPLDLSRNGYRMGLTLQAGAGIAHISDISDPLGFDEDTNRQGWFRPLHYAVRFFRGRGAYADIMPVWGQTVEMGYRHTPMGGDYHGRLFYVNSTAYLPGLFKRHGLRLGCAFERQQAENYRFSSEILFPRGYDYVAHEKFTKLSVDYALPLLYPDQHIWALLYFQRIKASLFFDYGEGRDTTQGRLYRSVGTEVTADVNILGIPVPLEAGSRFSYCIERKDWRVGILLGLSM